MSITSVSSKIKTAMKDTFISEAEAKAIVKEAEKGPVTVGEAKVIRELFERAPTSPPPGMMMTLAIPENPNDVTFGQGAKSVLETFFTKNNVPAGQNVKKFVDQIEAKISADGLGAELAQAPDTKKLHLVRLPSPPHVMDYPTRNAFVDTKKNEFYLSVVGGRTLGFPTAADVQWYGPISMEKKGGVTPERQGQLLAAFNKLDRAGTLNWTATGVPLGQRFERVPLFAERHPDGYSYTALIPVGALTPTAPKADPNTVKEFYVQRSGGFAGITMYTGLLTAKLPGDA